MILPAKGGEKGLLVGIFVGRAGGVLALASSIVSGMTSKTIGLAIFDVLITLTGINDARPVPFSGASFAWKSSSANKISTAINYYIQEAMIDSTYQWRI